MWVFILCIVALYIGFIALMVKLIKWLMKPTYWHKTSFGWYGTGHEKLTDRDKKHIRKVEKNSENKIGKKE
ncbi:MAG: hypothetical protein LUH07_12775 [Lachnospiraceae bacterium]|nr:hypothetical protein [Lachnospiraceae bacterium]